MYRSAACAFCLLFLTGSLCAECWMGHDRPLNSTEPRENALPEIEGGKILTLAILDETGKPMPKARLSYYGQPKPHTQKTHRHYVETGDDGTFTIRFKPNAVPRELQIEVDQPGYAPHHAEWVKPDTDPIPEKFSIQLEKATTVGGIIVDDTGKPIKGADVEFCVHWQHRSRTPQICSYRVWVKTDEKGVWSCNLIPPAMLKNDSVYFHADVKGFMPYEKHTPLADLAPNADGSFSNTVRMERGATVRGRITDEADKPIADAVVFGNYMSTREDFTTKTNENGEYVLENLPESDRAYIGVWSPGKMSTLKNFTVAKNSSPVVDVVMKPAGKPLKIKIVDKDGKPIKGYYICIERWGEHRLVNPILQTGKESLARTDENGYWIWNEAPENEVVFDMFIGPSIMDLRNKPMTARDEEYVFTAFPALKITGEVLDDTEQPMPTFKVFLGFQFENSSDYHWELQANAGKDGVYSIAENYPQAGFAVKIEAEGYEPAISRNITPDEGKITIDFSLQKLSAEKASQTLQGTVLTPDGKPATNATVVMATSKQHQMIDNGRIQGREPYAIKTDKEGKFKFAYIDFKKERRSDQNFPSDVKVSDYSICILHDSGFCRLSQNEMETTFKEKPIALEKWGRIEGTVYKGTKPAENVRLMFAPRFSEQGSSTWEPMVSWHDSVLSDGNGQFVFKQVPAVSGLVQQGVPIGKSSVTYTGGMKIDVRPGETTTVKIGGDGRPVTGKLISGGFETPPDWSFCTITCAVAIEKPDFTAMSKLADMLPFSIKAELDPAKKKELLEEWMNTTDEGKAYSEAFQVFNAKMREYYEARQGSSTKPCGVSEDGTFRLDDVSEGDWQIEVELKSPPPPGQFWSNTIIGKLEHRFTTGAIPNGVSDEPLDLGTLTIEKIEQPKPLLQVGQTTPDFELAQIFATTDTEAKKDAKLRLSDYKGKIIVLDFWATWCVPCLQKMPELRKLHESLKGNPRVVMIGISFDNKEAAESLGKFVTEKDMPWLHALAGNLLESKTAKDYGVSGIPALLLIGTDGKVLLSNPNIEEVAKKIEEMK